MSERPTLHEIAAMPFPASERALFKHYGVTPWREKKEGEIRSFKVRFNYSETISNSVTYTVDAVDEEDAERLADELFNQDKTLPSDIDLDGVDVEEVRS